MPSKNQVLVHRGVGFGEPNSLEALLGALKDGFSVELDVHNLDGELVISHDPPLSSLKVAMFQEFVTEANRLPNLGQVLAINVKQDGLAPIFQNITFELEHFFFDMSTPQEVVFRRRNLPCAARISEFESCPTILEGQEQEWIWVDSFDGEPLHHLHAAKGKGSKMVLVSPELHGFNPDDFTPLAKRKLDLDRNLFVCTDLWELYF